MTPEELLHGACDIHLHCAPAMVPRAMDQVEVAREAAAAGMRCICVKDEHAMSANVAQMVQKYAVDPKQNFSIFGSVVCGNCEGGLNPSAVETAIGYGAKIVWMPVLASAYHRMRSAQISRANAASMPSARLQMKYNPSMTIIDENGRLLPTIPDILDLIADADIALATGHLDPESEIRPLLEEAVKHHVKKVIITHPEYFHDTSLERMREYADAGFYVEHILTTLYSGKQTYDRLYELITTVYNGKNTIISSDMGLPGRPSPVTALRDFIAAMQERGLSDAVIRHITSENQRVLMNLEPLPR